jgi:hypothetical protein
MFNLYNIICQLFVCLHFQRVGLSALATAESNDATTLVNNVSALSRQLDYECDRPRNSCRPI